MARRTTKKRASRSRKKVRRFTIHGEHVWYNAVFRTDRFGPPINARGLALRIARNMAKFKHIYDHIIVIDDLGNVEWSS